MYIGEVSKFPPGLLTEPTSVPTFIGYAGTHAVSSIAEIKISSFTEFVQRFGNDGGEKYLFDSIRLFYENGGSDCYIIAVGSITDAVSFDAFVKRLECSKKFLCR